MFFGLELLLCLTDLLSSRKSIELCNAFAIEMVVENNAKEKSRYFFNILLILLVLIFLFIITVITKIYLQIIMNVLF